MSAGRTPSRAVVWAAAAVAGLVAALGTVGADALWLVPLGDRIVHGALPSSIPYATASTAGWHDVPAGAQVAFWAAWHALGGERGLVAWQVLCAAAGFGALAAGLRRQASGASALLVTLVALAGSLPAAAVTNVSCFTLALFPLLLFLLEAEAPVWWVVPVLALWGNLHGGVLVGFGLVACCLVLERGRRRPAESAAVLAASALALFANPELWHTPRYYLDVFRNEAARQGVGLWTPLGAGAFDILLVLVAVVLAGLAVRRRAFRLWEAVAAAGLAAATVHVSRNGTWLLFVLAYPAVRAVGLREARRGILVVVAAPVTVAVAAALVQAPKDPGSRSLARAAAARGGAVLAEPVLGQQVALAGGRVWVDNPVDAFDRADQRLYVDWAYGREGGAAAVRHASLVLVKRDSAAGRAAAKDSRLVLLSARDGAALYRVRGASPG